MNLQQRITGSAVEADSNIQIHWQHCLNASPEFENRVFDDAWLTSKGFVVNSPTAGRGASHFLSINEHQLVLRHYRRGGMVRNFSEKSYVWQGLKRTRAWQEFDVLCALEQAGLPAPRPYACQVKRAGLIYSASLITHYLDGLTLAERMCTVELSHKLWHAIGLCISQFHKIGVHHADLNAHNILVNDTGQISIIDFDRASVSSGTKSNRFRRNLNRLQRSLQKIDSSGPAHYNEKCWTSLVDGYEQGYS